MTIGWDHESNVTGYEIKVETLKDMELLNQLNCIELVKIH